MLVVVATPEVEPGEASEASMGRQVRLVAEAQVPPGGSSVRSIFSNCRCLLLLPDDVGLVSQSVEVLRHQCEVGVEALGLLRQQNVYLRARLTRNLLPQLVRLPLTCLPE